jgi:glycosyltransferase involved in cell wall biosynthesis
MRKKKILWVNEASWKGTGYGVYAREVLSRLHQVEEFEVAELACYIDATDENIAKTPWKVFPNRPPADAPHFQDYVNNPSRVFGEEKFNEVCLQFQPDIVMDIRDWWMFEYQQRSPFRNFFHWALMPTVDAAPQNPQWMNTFADADSVLAYSEFGRDTMLEQSDQIKFVDVASPAANKIFSPVEDKAAHKESMGLDSESVIIGTVMRNQRRKLYPDLFKAFRDYLDASKNPNVFLYVHSYYPDIGWEFPALLNRFGLNNRVLFSYKCVKCKHLSIDFFQDAINYCPKCSGFSKKLVGIDNSIDTEELSKVYNSFDLYVQYANSEGFGMPQLEAACCGVPIATVNYSAMASVNKNIDAITLDPLALTMECETGCYRAVPNNSQLSEILAEYVDGYGLAGMRKRGIEMAARAREHYDWDKTAQVWIDHLKSIPLRDPSETWLSTPQVKPPAETIPEEITNLQDQVDYLFNYVLHKPEWIGSYLWSKTIKDCTFGYRVQNSEDDYYFNESHAVDQNKYKPFNFNDAAKDFIYLRNQWNQWEQLRGKVNANRK